MKTLSLKTPNNVDELKKLYEENQLVYYTPKEELVNTLTHALGAVAMIVFLALMLLKATTPTSIATAIISPLCLGIEFAISATYHGVSKIPLKRVWRKIDYPAVVFNVIGCGTPLCLLYDSIYGYVAMGLCLAIAVAMIPLCVCNFKVGHKVSVASTFIVGALLFAAFFVAFFSPMGVPKISGYLYIVGLGLCLIGAILFKVHVRYAHCVFHLFVLVGPIFCMCSNYFQLI